MSKKTIIVSVRELRNNTKGCLDYAVQGGIVVVDRNGQRFMLSYLPREVDFVIDLNGVVEKNLPLSPAENNINNTPLEERE